MVWYSGLYFDLTLKGWSKVTLSHQRVARSCPRVVPSCSEIIPSCSRYYCVNRDMSYVMTSFLPLKCVVYNLPQINPKFLS